MKCDVIPFMQPMRRVTVRVSRRDLEIAQQYTGKGISETCRIALLALVETQGRRETSLSGLDGRGKSDGQ